jgi:hypothetical protein
MHCLITVFKNELYVTSVEEDYNKGKTKWTILYSYDFEYV